MPIMKKCVSEGLQTFPVPRAVGEELFITATLESGEAPLALFAKAAAVLREKDARIVSQEIFGLSHWQRDMKSDLHKTFGEAQWPVTWIGGQGEHAPLAGMQLWAISGLPIQPVWLDGSLVGSVFEDDSAHYCRLGGVGPENLMSPPADQARQTFERLEAGLQAAGMGFGDVLRTWFFNDRILSWYPEFNRARDAFFTERRTYEGLVPASTGIGGGNPEGAALTSGLFAVQPKSGYVRCQAVPSPLQCAPMTYGSAFSRAVELVTPGVCRLFVSGTASIAQGGGTDCLGNADGQVARTMEVVEAILDSRGMGWSHVSRAIAYFKHIEDVHSFERYCSSQIDFTLPVLLVHADVCRDDLLFEIEVDAIQMEPRDSQNRGKEIREWNI
jgi:enamine deaminase RidA (YjgF/YER057c/UK114 family)